MHLGWQEVKHEEQAWGKEWKEEKVYRDVNSKSEKGREERKMADIAECHTLKQNVSCSHLARLITLVRT